MLLYVSVIDMLNLVVACRNKCAGSLVDKTASVAKDS